MFELGFFNPGSSTNRFLGIRYKATPEVVVWVANRGNPIINGQIGVLTLAKNGSLILRSAQGTIIWSSNSSMAASSAPLLQLLDTGNLVVVEKSMNIWQSFDYPGNTRLPGMKMGTVISSSNSSMATSSPVLKFLDTANLVVVEKSKNIKFPDTLNFRLNSSMSDECLKNCSCSAYADPYSSSHNACLM
ncbi:S-locus lectin protein kinase family protein [Perilla frutescens var. frutescens]|nr:S-locus lectin protein kinase family protein [Perilla frutescens var. frutescens]